VIEIELPLTLLFLTPLPTFVIVCPLLLLLPAAQQSRLHLPPSSHCLPPRPSSSTAPFCRSLLPALGRALALALTAALATQASVVLVVSLALQASSSCRHLLAVVVPSLAIQATLNCCDDDGNGDGNGDGDGDGDGDGNDDVDGDGDGNGDGDGSGNAMDKGADKGFYLIM